MEALQKELENHLKSFSTLQKSLRKAISTKQQLDTQLNENELVKEELDLQTEDGIVYKSVGPLLIKTDLIEARQNVSKRIDYINGEIKRLDTQISSMDKEQDTLREALQKVQVQMQQARGK